jgi:hypothetical protein
VRNVLVYVLNNVRKHEAMRHPTRASHLADVDPASSGAWPTTLRNSPTHQQAPPG